MLQRFSLYHDLSSSVNKKKSQQQQQKHQLIFAYLEIWAWKSRCTFRSNNISRYFYWLRAFFLFLYLYISVAVCRRCWNNDDGCLLLVESAWLSPLNPLQLKLMGRAQLECFFFYSPSTNSAERNVDNDNNPFCSSTKNIVAEGSGSNGGSASALLPPQPTDTGHNNKRTRHLCANIYRFYSLDWLGHSAVMALICVMCDYASKGLPAKNK